MSRKLYIALFAISFTVLFSLNAVAQSNFIRKVGRSKMPERGLVIQAGVGAAAIKSDVCGSWGCNDIGPAVGIGALYKLSPFFAVSAEADYMRLGATEKEPVLNIAFQSEVIEVTTSVLYNLLDSYSGAGYRSSRKRFVVPFVKAGGGFIYYSATSFPSGNDLDDSQAKFDPARNYPAFAGVAQFGGGLRFRFSDQISIAPEMMYHVTTTNYLDDIGDSRGKAGNKDHYGVISFRIQYTPSVKNDIFSRKNQRR